MGRRNGEGNYTAIGSIFYHGIVFLLLLAAVVTGATLMWGEGLMRLIIKSDAVAEAATTYLNWRVVGYGAAVICAMFRAFYVATTNTRTLTYNSIIMVGGNIILNYALIFGALGMPRMGIAGAALASSLASIISVVFFIVYTLAKTDFRKYALNRLPRLRVETLSSVLGVGVWTMIQNFLALATWFIFFLGVEHLGESELASSNVLRNISGFFFMSMAALGATASTLSSNLLGQKETSSVMPLMWRIVRLCYLVMVPFCLLVAIFPDPVIQVFTTDAALIEMSISPLRILIFSYLFGIPAQILLHVVSGTGNTRTALCAELVTLAIYVLYLAVAVFGIRSNLTICWASEVVYSAGLLIYCWCYLRLGTWKNRQI
jgi:putative MATE family efflux protein